MRSSAGGRSSSGLVAGSAPRPQSRKDRGCWSGSLVFLAGLRAFERFGVDRPIAALGVRLNPESRAGRARGALLDRDALVDQEGDRDRRAVTAGNGDQISFFERQATLLTPVAIQNITFFKGEVQNGRKGLILQQQSRP